MTIFRFAFLLCSLAIFAGQTKAAESPARIAFTLASQPLEQALNEFARQAHLIVLRRDEEVSLEGLTSPAVTGELSAQEALERLLSNSGLTYEFVNERTVRIATSSALEPAVSKAGAAQTTQGAGDMRLAQAETAGSPQSTSAGATSAEAPASDAVLEEITVTAQKRVERLRDVPISISVLSGRDLDKKTSGGVIDALNSVPGVTASVLPQSGSAFVSVRGVASGANTGAGGHTAGYYLDSTPFIVSFVGASTPDTSAYDLSRVEVLRGPQGTLYGVNSVSGVVRVLTNDPNLESFEAKGRLSTSSVKDGEEGYRGDVAVNVPLMAGKLAVRAVAGYEDQGGWIDRANKDDINDKMVRNFRLKVGASPVDNLKINLSAWKSESDYAATPAADDNGIRNVLIDEPVSIDMDLYTLTLGYEFESFSISSNTSKMYYDLQSLKRSIFSANFSNAFVDATTFSQEINLNSRDDAKLRWSFGGIYTKTENGIRQRLGPSGTILSLPFSFVTDNTSESAAIFGQAGYHVTDDLELALGVRRFRDEVTLTSLTSPPQEATFSATTPMVRLTWIPSKDLTVYGAYSQGFRSGALQTPAASAQFGDADPDRLYNYEVGAKAAAFNGRISFDTALYYMQWDDVQQSLGVPFNGSVASATVNGPSASGLGFELGANIRPVDGLELGLTLGWNDLTFDETVLQTAAVFPPTVPPTTTTFVLFEKGARLNASGEYTYGASVNYSFPLGGGGLEARWSAAANYQSRLVSRFPLGTFVSVIEGDPILIGRTSLSVGPTSDRWALTLFGDNVTNEDGATLGAWSPGGQPDEATRVRPRTFGVQFELRM